MSIHTDNMVTSDVLAIDPGSAKWGLAVVKPTGECRYREVVPAATAAGRVRELISEFPISEVLLGDRTGSKRAGEQLQGISLPITRVEEHGTTLLARELYWRDRPPTGWRRWMPRGLLTPPVPLDAYAAEALALRYFGLIETR